MPPMGDSSDPRERRDGQPLGEFDLIARYFGRTGRAGRTEGGVVSLGIGDEWVEHGTPAQLYALCGYDEEGILRALLAAGK